MEETGKIEAIELVKGKSMSKPTFTFTPASYVHKRTGPSIDVDILEEAERYFRGVKDKYTK
jgi:hypothetical protein